MSGKNTCVLILAVLLVLTGAEERSQDVLRKPSCGSMPEVPACPLNLAPVCGSDGITYANECALCVRGLETRVDILIVKEESC